MAAAVSIRLVEPHPTSSESKVRSEGMKHNIHSTDALKLTGVVRRLVTALITIHTDRAADSNQLTSASSLLVLCTAKRDA